MHSRAMLFLAFREKGEKRDLTRFGGFWSFLLLTLYVAFFNLFCGRTARRTDLWMQQLTVISKHICPIIKINFNQMLEI